MRSRSLYLTAAMALAPLTLAAQDSTAAARGAGRADARVEAALETALEAGIPVSLLERKIAEGKAKGVPMERIAEAVQNRLDALTRARDAMASGGLTSTTEGELSVAADAVQAGVSETALVTISQTAPEDRRTVAIAVLADLVTLGHASERALTRVQAALARGPEALANLRGESAAGLRAAGAGGVGVQAGAGAGAGARVEIGAPRRN